MILASIEWGELSMMVLVTGLAVGDGREAIARRSSTARYGHG